MLLSVGLDEHTNCLWFSCKSKWNSSDILVFQIHDYFAWKCDCLGFITLLGSVIAWDSVTIFVKFCNCVVFRFVGM